MSAASLRRRKAKRFDRDSIELPEVQEKLVQALHATGKPVIMVNCSGSAMAMPWEAEHLPAILQAWYPGEQGGRAVAEVLFGEVNPSGHLPVTFYLPRRTCPAFTDYSMSNRTYRYFNGTAALRVRSRLELHQIQISEAAGWSRKRFPPTAR